eukprot:365184-Chlamydomonas_euryale.AAC.9
MGQCGSTAALSASHPTSFALTSPRSRLPSVLPTPPALLSRPLVPGCPWYHACTFWQWHRISHPLVPGCPWYHACTFWQWHSISRPLVPGCPWYHACTFWQWHSIAKHTGRPVLVSCLRVTHCSRHVWR